MLNHSLCLTDASPLLQRQFTDGKELLFYTYEHPDQLTDLIFDLLSSDCRVKEISQNGYFCAKENHSWQARAALLLSIVK